jgi:uncharacterized protein YcbK (DUF882 family)
MTWSRRRLLRTGGAALAGASAAALLAGSGRAAEAVRGRRIALFNLHTSERLEVEFSRDGAYLPDALSAIEGILRDFRNGERHAIDPGLLDYLADVAHTLGVDPSFSVISGYRSAQTNARLHERSAGVAKHSLHMEGRAIDVRIAGVDCAALSAHALELKRGGVGYYRASDFVHLDTGRVRSWNG